MEKLWPQSSQRGPLASLNRYVEVIDSPAATTASHSLQGNWRSKQKSVSYVLLVSNYSLSYDPCLYNNSTKVWAKQGQHKGYSRHREMGKNQKRQSWRHKKDFHVSCSRSPALLSLGAPEHVHQQEEVWVTYHQLVPETHKLSTFLILRWLPSVLPFPHLISFPFFHVFLNIQKSEKLKWRK